MKKIFTRKLAHIVAYIASCYLFIGLIRCIPFTLPIIDPYNDQIGQYDIYDKVFIHLHNQRSIDNDTNMVIINTQDNDRAKLADCLRRLDSLQVKVVGIDILFDSLQNPRKDTLLYEAISNCKAPIIFGAEQSKGKMVNKPNPFFEIKDSTLGYTDFYASVPFSAKAFVPFTDSMEHFVPKILNQYKYEKYIGLKKRKKEKEWINFRRKQCGESNYVFPINSEKICKYYYSTIDAFIQGKDQISTETYKNKIVLLGYCGTADNALSMKDRVITPLNEYLGRTKPDMHGVFVHANIISMALADDYIDDLPSFFVNGLGFLLLIFAFTMSEKYPFEGKLKWVRLILTRTTQIALLILLVFVAGWLLDGFNVKMSIVYLATLLIISHDMYEFYNSFIKAMVDFVCDVTLLVRGICTIDMGG
jgi:CHASE2 domain-containing sensor protein